MINPLPFLLGETILRTYDFFKDSVSEYFFGTKTKEFKEKEREFYGEFTSSKQLYTDYLKKNLKSEKIEILLGRTIPNIISSIGIAVSVKYNNPTYFFAITVPSEIWRNTMTQFDRQNKSDSIYRMKDLERRCKSDCSNLNDYMGFLNKDRFE